MMEGEERDIGAVDQELGVSRSPVKMAKRSLEGSDGVEWSTPSVKERGHVKDAFGGSSVLDKLGILEDSDVAELRELMTKGVRERIVDEDGETLASMAYAAPVSACQGKAVRAALDKTFNL